MHKLSTIAEVFLIFLRLGLSAFGGPVAHLAYFHETFVRRRQWLSESLYAQVVGLCQLLPGPSSSQAGMAIGLVRAGRWGAVAAWLGFTLPSAVLMTGFALALHKFDLLLQSGVLRGLKWAALAVVAHAVVAMARSLCPDLPRRVLAVLVAVPLLFVNHPLLQLGLLLVGGGVGIAFFTESTAPQNPESGLQLSRRSGAIALALFAVLLFALPVVAHEVAHPLVSLFDSFFRTGALVFGGGHVVLPLITTEFVDQKLLSRDVVLAGYGAVQAVPGPLFSFAAFLGAASTGQAGAVASGAVVSGAMSPVALSAVSPVVAAGVSIVAIFLPSFLLIFGVLPFWNRLQDFHAVRKAITGMNAAVVGLLFAALMNPFIVVPAPTLAELLLFAANFVVLQFFRWPAWLVVVLSALGAFYMPMVFAP